MVPFTRRIHEALDFAAVQHDGQKRKDPDISIPYLSHLFAVSYILAQYGFPEDVVVAGILHDLLEDVVQKKHKPEVEGQLKSRFGENVHALVSLVTQRKRDSCGRKIDWHKRGEDYRLLLCDPSTPAEAKAISCADKIHNIQSLLMALDRHEGKERKMWGKLNATPEEQLEKFRLLYEGLRQHWQHAILDELQRKIKDLEGRVANASPV